jgi:hypothetical protein
VTIASAAFAAASTPSSARSRTTEASCVAAWNAELKASQPARTIAADAQVREQGRHADPLAGGDAEGDLLKDGSGAESLAEALDREELEPRSRRSWCSSISSALCTG